jgi:CubicO group peptidase (beta-lactamase class C family)
MYQKYHGKESYRDTLYTNFLSKYITPCLPTMPLPAEVVQNLKTTVDAACADPKTTIPGTSVVVVGKDGEELFAHAAGQRGVASSEDMTLDTVFWIASCTKMVAGLACMQLVEQGQLHLDDGEEIERLVPELKETKVLQKDGSLVDKKRKITLRMLLSHTGMSQFLQYNIFLLI